MNADPFDAYRSAVESAAIRSIWAEVYGNRFWPDADQPWSMATMDDVRFVTDQLRIRPSDRLVDLGCGAGCLSRHLARAAKHIDAIDANPLATRLARERTANQGLSDTVSFHTGDIAATQFPDATFDGAMSFDVLLLPR